MTRVYVICEGQTEETFIHQLLTPSLQTRQIYLIPRLIGKSGHRGGNVTFERLFIDVRAMLNDKSAYCTTFFDFYGLQQRFPGKAAAGTQADISAKADSLLQAMVGRLQQHLGADLLRRFIPYVQMYEFEALLFSDPVRLASGIHQPASQAAFQAIRDKFPTPEHINDSPNTAPSKRIEQHQKRYKKAKATLGPEAAQSISLTTIRRECHLFDCWLTRLETLASGATPRT